MFKKLKERNMESGDTKNKINILEMKTTTSKMESTLDGISKR